MLQTTEHIIQTVNQIVAKRGKSPDAAIPILQDIQQEFNYLPEEALKHVCEITEITPARITGISTFYTQFRHQPAGKHIIRVCTGTACHVKGATRVYDAIARELKLTDGQETDAAGTFTLETVACLGCCTLAPVIKIDDTTYGHVLPEKVNEVMQDFLSKSLQTQQKKVAATNNDSEVMGEIRIGLGSCCVASGSEEVKLELEKILSETKINVNVKQVGCVGVCNQVPVMEIIKPGQQDAFYAKVKAEEVKEIVLSHFQPSGFFNRLKNNFVSSFEKVVVEGEPSSFRKYMADQRDTPISEFLGPQLAI
ncbi:MAG TPA: NADH-quinone oxidoreductase subunit NuoE, partial [Bacteroidales bacterium]|nr:NADH-quinone oxidoreductase subunit NuoE [Bacteroidales bacterium]